MTHVYNPQTRALLDKVRTNPPQSLLLRGVVGVGLLTAAKDLAGARIAHTVYPTDIKGEVDTTKGIIRVADIRYLYSLVRGKSKTKRYIVIDGADTMNTTAQNAFLKLLEEPQPNVYFILTAHRPELLLPTIISRVQTVTILPLDENQTKAFIRRGVDDEQKIRQLMFIASGRPAELSRLMNDDAYFERQSKLVTSARTLLSSNTYERIRIAHEYFSDREMALDLIRTAILVIQFTIQNKPSPQLLETAERLSTAYDRIKNNGSVRTQLVAAVV